MEGSDLPPAAQHPRRHDRLDPDAPAAAALRVSGTPTNVSVPFVYLHPLRLLWLLCIQPRQVLHQQPVDEDVAAADFVEEVTSTL